MSDENMILEHMIKTQRAIELKGYGAMAESINMGVIEICNLRAKVEEQEKEIELLNSELTI
jgi:hypothetical protein